VNRRLLPTAGYFVDFDMDADGPEPSPRRFTDFIAAQIAVLPPHEDLQLPPDPSAYDYPVAVYEEAGARIPVRFMPMGRDAPAKTDPDARIVGMGPTIGGVVNSGQRLKDRVESKAGGRYDIAGAPFVVAVGVHDFLCAHDETTAALYGLEAVDLATHNLMRRNDGVFGLDRNQPQGRHSRLSGVALVTGMRPWNLAATDITVYQNPHAADPLPDRLLASSRRYGAVAVGDGRRALGWR
jgi:hypothetical protein